MSNDLGRLALPFVWSFGGDLLAGWADCAVVGSAVNLRGGLLNCCALQMAVASLQRKVEVLLGSIPFVLSLQDAGRIFIVLSGVACRLEGRLRQAVLGAAEQALHERAVMHHVGVDDSILQHGVLPSLLWQPGFEIEGPIHAAVAHASAGSGSADHTSMLGALRAVDAAEAAGVKIVADSAAHALQHRAMLLEALGMAERYVLRPVAATLPSLISAPLLAGCTVRVRI